MRNTQIIELAEESEQLLSRVRQLHEQILKLSDTSSSYFRLQEIFQRDVVSPEPRAVSPYEPITPSFWTSFSDDAGFGCTIAGVEPDGADLNGRYAIKLTPKTESETPWLAVEFAMPWSEVRAAKHLSVTLFATATRDCLIHAQLIYWDVDGQRYDGFGPSMPSTEMLSYMKSHRIDAEYRLSQDARIDFSRDPVVALFLDPSVVEYVISDISIRLR